MASGSLSTAKWIMIVVGLLTVAVNIFLFLNAEAEVNTVMQQGQADLDAGTLLLFVRVFYGGFILSGLVMITLGALVYQFPLASPIAGLVIYLLGIVIVALLDPLSLLRGIIFKILIISGLIKAINDGAYYKK